MFGAYEASSILVQNAKEGRQLSMASVAGARSRVVQGNVLRKADRLGSVSAYMGRVLGVDYGRRRVGVALSDPGAMLSTGLTTLNVQSVGEAVARVAATARERGATEIVVGLPLNMDGTRGPMADEVSDFVRRLAAASGVPVLTWDERLSTGMAERTLLDADMSRQRRKEVRDKLAAQLILQGFLDARQPFPDMPEDEDEA